MSKIKGFSLIELSVSLIIIAVLASVILSGAGIKKTARIAGAKSLTSSANLAALGDLVLWLDAVDVGNITIETDGTVSSWQDISSVISGVSLTQGTASARPTYVEDVINGLPVIRFDGTNDVLQILSEDNLLLSDEFSLFLVYVSNDGSSVGLFSNTYHDGANYHGFQTLANSGGITFYFATGSGLGQNNVGNGHSDVQKILIIESSAASQFFQFNSGTLTRSFTFNASPEGQVFLGARLDAASNSPGNFGEHDIGEVILFKRNLSATESAGVLNYLSKKWKIEMTYLGS
jgi:prepilin-type N-terminal cleavage/methylation domain-containing protein